MMMLLPVQIWMKWFYSEKKTYIKGLKVPLWKKL